MTAEHTDREEGVDFTEINPVLAEVGYPIPTGELVSQYGDHTIGRTNADALSVRELFEGTGPETFDSSEDVRQSVLALMPGDSVGRQRYSDRGGATPTDGVDDSI